MKEIVTRGDALPLMQKLAADLEAGYESITKLDAEIGDGDLGVTCRLGLKAAMEVSSSLANAGLGEVLLKAGMAFNSAGASTFGALVATAAMRAAKYMKDNNLEAWDLPSLIGALTAAAHGIEQRGKASRGEKTLLDALWPAIEALQAAQDARKSLSQALADAATAADAGAEATKPLRSKYGRAAWMQDRTVGVEDAGARVVATVVRSLAEFVRTAS
jgi:dihydroxyacetone kinase-like protein